MMVPLTSACMAAPFAVKERAARRGALQQKVLADWFR